MSVISTWLFVTGIVTVILVGMLAIVNVVGQYRSLLNEGVPMPCHVVYQRTIGRLVPGATHPLDHLVGRAAFLSWDVRWGDSGTTTARILGVGSTDSTLSIRLSKPIMLQPTDAVPRVQLSEVRFVPVVVSRAGFGKKEVSGYLEPCLLEGLYVKASIVVYPESVELMM